MNILKLFQTNSSGTKQGRTRPYLDDQVFQKNKDIEIGQPVPDFSLADVNGQPFQLSSLRHKANVLLVFNRGFT